MGKLDGNGAECMVKFIADGYKGDIMSRGGGPVYMDEKEWRRIFMGFCQKWLATPCTYTPPESKWVECTAGEALDSLMIGKNIQLSLMGENVWVDVPAGWTGWTTKCRKYRKEA